MSWWSAIGFAMAIAVAIYLVWAVLNAEDLQ